MSYDISLNSNDSVSFNDVSNSKRANKGNSIIAFPTSYCMLDLETTGKCPGWDDIIEIAAIKYAEGRETARFQSLVQPPQSITPFITEFTGITNDMLKDAPQIADVIREFDAFLGDAIIMGYNVSFDINFLYDAYEEHLHKPLSNDFIDCLRMARRLHPEMVHHRLCDISEKLGVVNKRAHRAMSDVEATQECYLLLSKEAFDKYGSEEAFVKTWKNKGRSNGLAKTIIAFDDIKIDPDNPLFGKVCVFTGKLDKFERKDAMQIVANLGGINGDGVTKKTNYLILGNNDYCSTIKDGKSSKQKKAEQYILEGYDIEIIPESVFYEMIGDLLTGENIAQTNSCSSIKEEIPQTTPFIPLEEEENVETETDTFGLFEEEEESTPMGSFSSNWMIILKAVLDDIAKNEELPDNSLLFIENIGRVTKKLTSYTVALRKPDFPKGINPNGTAKNALINIKVLKTRSEPVERLSISIPDSLLVKVGGKYPNIPLVKKKSETVTRAVISVEDVKLNEFFVFVIRTVLDKYFKEGSDTFGCCHLYKQCSDAKKCLHENKLYARSCIYGRHLAEGRIFYGKNRNI